MTNVLVTGMSGTGKSTALDALALRGHRVVDTDTDEWCEWVRDASDAPDWVWREDRMAALLAAPPTHGTLYVAGCKSNQGRFYDRFDAVVLLSAPAAVIVERIAARTTNAYGKTPDERELVLQHLATVEPLLRATADVEIDATRPLAEVVGELESIGWALRSENEGPSGDVAAIHHRHPASTDDGRQTGDSHQG